MALVADVAGVAVVATLPALVSGVGGGSVGSGVENNVDHNDGSACLSHCMYHNTMTQSIQIDDNDAK